MFIDQYTYAKPVTLSDTVDIPLVNDRYPDALYIGTPGATGTMIAVWPDTTTSTFVGIAANTILPIKVRRINSTSSTVSTVLALYRV